MRNLLIASLLLTSIVAKSQTNTFPTSGNVGIGITSPGAKLSFNNLNDETNQADGITWYSPSPLSYGIYRTAGSWTAPNYQQLKFSWDTGIVLDPGSLYGKSYVDIQGAGLRVSSGNVGIGSASPSARLDVAESGGGSGTGTALRLRSGNSYNYFGNNQILFSYNGGTGYSHAIKTRHSSGSISGNALDFYVWKPGDAVEAIGSNLAMTLDGGNVGIGTSSPSNKLQVTGGDIGLDADQPLRGGGKWLISGNSSMVTVGTANPGVGLRFYAGADVNRMIIDPATGNVGIGSQTPTQKLTVNGTIYGKEVKVDLAVPGPDYVFEEDYKLTPLEDIKTYIDQYKHLPEVPSAKEMEKNGIQLGEMNMLLLKKIEELTLYVIEQQKQIKELKETMNKEKR